MILVDSSVWVDFFRGNATPQTERLNELFLTDLVAVGDLILTEVLQGFASDEAFRTARRMLSHLDLVVIGGSDVMIEAANNVRTLRTRGITVRKTIDTLIATRCIVSGIPLLHADRDSMRSRHILACVWWIADDGCNVDVVEMVIEAVVLTVPLMGVVAECLVRALEPAPRETCTPRRNASYRWRAGRDARRIALT